VQSSIIIGQPGFRGTDPDYLTMVAMNHVLGGGFSSRVNMNLREKHGYTYGAGSSFDLRPGAGALRISSDVRTNATDSALAEALGEYRRIATETVPELAVVKPAFAPVREGALQPAGTTSVTLEARPPGSWPTETATPAAPTCKGPVAAAAPFESTGTIPARVAATDPAASRRRGEVMGTHSSPSPTASAPAFACPRSPF